MARVREGLEGGHTSATFPETPTVRKSNMAQNYLLLTVADLKAVAALRGISLSSRATKVEIVEVLEAADRKDT